MVKINFARNKIHIDASPYGDNAKVTLIPIQVAGLVDETVAVNSRFCLCYRLISAVIGVSSLFPER